MYVCMYEYVCMCVCVCVYEYVCMYGLNYEKRIFDKISYEVDSSDIPR
jgi:hypothetical protein